MPLPANQQKLYEAVTTAARACANAKNAKDRDRATKAYREALKKYHAAIDRRNDTQPSPS